MSGELYTSDEKDALFRAQIRALNGGETVGAELLRLRKENAEMRKCLAEAVEIPCLPARRVYMKEVS